MRFWNRLARPSGFLWLALGLVLAACGNGGKPGY